MLIRDSTDLASIQSLRGVNFPNMLLDDGRRCKNRRTLGTLSALFGVPKDVAIQGSLAPELLRTVRALVRHFSGVQSKVHFQCSFMEKPPVAEFALELLDPIVDLFMLLQRGAKFEKLSAKLTI